jgi:hypothetical protein
VNHEEVIVGDPETVQVSLDMSYGPPIHIHDASFCRETEGCFTNYNG